MILKDRFHMNIKLFPKAGSLGPTSKAGYTCGALRRLVVLSVNTLYNGVFGLANCCHFLPCHLIVCRRPACRLLLVAALPLTACCLATSRLASCQYRLPFNAASGGGGGKTASSKQQVASGTEQGKKRQATDINESSGKSKA